MKITYSESWCRKMAHIEEDYQVEAGVFGYTQNTMQNTMQKPEFVVSPPSVVPFGRFVKLMRRKEGLSVELLADNADIDLDELVEIEDDSSHMPEPRTVYQLSHFFNVPTKNLMQVAGLSSSRNENLVNESMKFAARSDSTAPLSSEEQAALEAFVTILGQE